MTAAHAEATGNGLRLVLAAPSPHTASVIAAASLADIIPLNQRLRDAIAPEPARRTPAQLIRTPGGQVRARCPGSGRAFTLTRGAGESGYQSGLVSAVVTLCGRHRSVRFAPVPPEGNQSLTRGPAPAPWISRVPARDKGIGASGPDRTVAGRTLAAGRDVGREGATVAGLDLRTGATDRFNVIGADTAGITGTTDLLSGDLPCAGGVSAAARPVRGRGRPDRVDRPGHRGPVQDRTLPVGQNGRPGRDRRPD